MLLSYSDNRNGSPAEVSDWPTRVLLAVIALGGTLAYAASFRCRTPTGSRPRAPASASQPDLRG